MTDFIKFERPQPHSPIEINPEFVYNFVNHEGVVRLTTASGYIDVVGTLEEVARRLRRPTIEKWVIRVHQPRPRGTKDGGHSNMSTIVAMNDEQEVIVDYSIATELDAAGNTVGTLPAGSTISATVDEPDVCSATPDPNGGLSLLISSEDAVSGASVGQTNVNVSISTPDGKNLVDVIAVNVTTSDPTTIAGVAVGTPTPRSPTA